MLRFFALLSVCLLIPTVHAKSDPFSTEIRDALTNRAMTLFWGRYTDTNGKPMEPASEKERRTLLIKRKHARQYVMYGLLSGALERCNENWSKVEATLRKHSHKQYKTHKQRAFIDFLNIIAQANGYAWLEGRECTNKDRKRLLKIVKRL